MDEYLKEPYGIYLKCDNLLRYISEQKRKAIKRTTLKKNNLSVLMLTLLQSYKFIAIEGEGKAQLLQITEEGEIHLRTGGFRQMLGMDPARETKEKKSFKQHLDETTGLLTIFGILNAITIFAAQFHTNEIVKPTEVSLNVEGANLISISMYLLSLLVLWEIIYYTVDRAEQGFKFTVFYILLGSTTMGVGVLFVSQYVGVVYSLAFLGAYGGLIALFGFLTVKLITLLITRRTAPWFKKHAQLISFLSILIALILAVCVFIYVITHFLKK